MIAPVEANLGEGSGDELFERVRHTRSNDKVVRRVALQHQPHCLNIIRNPTPVAIHGQITEREPLAAALRNTRCGAGDLAGDEARRSQRGLVVEQDA